MKKLSIVLLAVLLIASLIISCDNSTKALTDELVEVQLGTQARSRDLQMSVTLEQISDPSLTWYYSATKQSQKDFQTGATTCAEIALGTTKPFSQGKWDFELWAMKGVEKDSTGTVTNNGTKVYYGKLTDVLITKSPSSSPVSVVINVSPSIIGQKGSVRFNRVLIKAQTSTEESTITAVPTSVVVGSKVCTLDDEGNGTVTDLEPGQYDVIVKYEEFVDGVTVLYAYEKIVVTVYSNRETVIDGLVAEETTTAEITVIGTAATVNQNLTSTPSGESKVNIETTISAPVTPAKAFETAESGAVSAKATEIKFEEGAFKLTGSEDKAELKIDTTSIEDSNFAIEGTDAESGLTSVAGLDIVLKVNDSDVTTFNENKYATVSTYIAKNLTNVGVRYKNPTTGVITSYTIATVDSDPTTISDDGYYIASSGKLVFKTTHFSEYYVVADACVYIKETNKAYSTLNDALNDIGNGVRATLVLLKNLEGTNTITINKSIVLDLNGKTIKNTNTTKKEGTTIINNGNLTIIDSGVNGNVESVSNAAIAAGNNSITTIESGTYLGPEGAVITSYATGATINIKGGTFTASDNAVIAGNGTNRDGEPNTINITGGTFNGNIKSSGYVACGIYAPWKDIINVSGGTFKITKGAGIVARAGNVNVSGGEFNCTGNVTGMVGDSRIVVPCSVFVFDSDANYPALTADSKITVTGGTFTSQVNSINVIPAESDVNTRIDVSISVSKSEQAQAAIMMNVDG